MDLDAVTAKQATMGRLKQMCLPESIIHCYLDHELSSEIIDKITLHISSCSECDAALIKAKEEAALLEFALTYEMTLPVPTKRLGARIKVAILAMTN